MAYADPFVVQIGREKAIFVKVLPGFFVRTTGLQQKLLILIESSNITGNQQNKKKVVVLHPSEVDKMSTRNFWELSGKK